MVYSSSLRKNHISILKEIQYRFLKYAGDIAFRVLERINNVSRTATEGRVPEVENETQVYVCDINVDMLNVGKKRAHERG